MLHGTKVSYHVIKCCQGTVQIQCTDNAVPYYLNKLFTYVLCKCLARYLQLKLTSL